VRWLITTCLVFVWAYSCASAKPLPGKQVGERVGDVLARLSDGGSLDDAADETEALFDEVVRESPSRDREAFIEGAFGWKACRLLERAEDDQVAPTAKIFLNHPTLARTLVFLAGEQDDVPGMLSLLHEIDGEAGLDLDEYASLVSAFCVVHDRRIGMRVNENKVVAEDPMGLLRYFVRNESELLYGTRGVPAELLVFVVDCAAPVSEMEWALERYAGDRRVGKRFFDIEYDYRHAYAGTDKRVTLEGFTLQNIAEYGGVCADQAYFAMTVAKSIGVPAVYTTARSAEVGHAWVGYLEWRGNNAVWNFDEGRYRDYQGLRGEVREPQTGGSVADSTVSLLGELIGTKREERMAAAAFTLASEHLAGWRAEGDAKRTRSRVRVDDRPRTNSVGMQLALLECGLRICPGYQPGWRRVELLAPRMTLAQKRMWSEAVLNLCGTSSPDFALDLLTPMIRTVEDADEQDALWDDVYKRVSKRKDLAASIRLEQARLAAKSGDRDGAWRYYNGVIERHMDDGPFACTALEELAELLDDAGKHELVLPLYERAFGIAPRPTNALMFSSFSNYHRVGRRYAELLREQTRYDEADRIEDLLGG